MDRWTGVHTPAVADRIPIFQNWSHMVVKVVFLGGVGEDS